MRNKKTLIISAFIIVVAVFLSVCFGVVVPNMKLKQTSSMQSGSVVNKNYETNTGESENKNETNKGENDAVNQPDNGNSDTPTVTVKNELEFFVYDKLVTKIKEIRGETTTFEINFKVFVTNNTKLTKNILSSAFTSSYDLSGLATYYTFECENEESSITLDAMQTKDFEFTLKYIVTDTANFKVDEKHNLVVGYMLKDVVSLEI